MSRVTTPETAEMNGHPNPALGAGMAQATRKMATANHLVTRKWEQE